jgi:3-dehydroquinate synthase
MHQFDTAAYSIFLGPLADALPEWLRARDYTRVLLITDENTRRCCAPVLESAWQALGIRPEIAEIPAGEQHKNIDMCARLWQAMLDARLDRRALAVNLGGGVIGDMGGFCAATWKRGIDFVQAPTTLLSMTDAAIGGKLGIDFQGIKNTVGVFQNPAAVFVDPVFLKTLPARELRSGTAEVLKHAQIGDPDLWRILTGKDYNSPDFDWLSVLKASIAVKVRVVTEDPFEKGLRMVLNYGHTIGHAVETYFLGTDDPLTHGEAIAIGMIAESYLAYGEGERLSEIVAGIRAYFPHRQVPEGALSAVWSYMLQDKKNAGKSVRMAVPGDAGPYSMRTMDLEQRMLADGMAYYAAGRTG